MVKLADYYRKLEELEGKFGMSFWHFPSKIFAHQYLYVYRKLGSLPAGSHVVDWGSGNGHMSVFLLESGFRVTALDVADKDALGHLGEEYGGRFEFTKLAGPVKLPLADKSINALLSTGVLEHVRESGGDEEGSLKEIYRALRPGGRFMCFHLPNKYSLSENLGRLVWKITSKEHAHKYSFSYRQIKSLLAGAGFRIVEHGYYNFLPRSFLFSRLPPAIGNNGAVAFVYDKIDALLSVLCRGLCQNHYICAERTRDA